MKKAAGRIARRPAKSLAASLAVERNRPATAAGTRGRYRLASAPSRDSPNVLARFNAELDLVDLLARQMIRATRVSTFTLDDLRSAGREGLLSAARTFDPDRGVPFRRWANLRIRGAMIDGLRQWGGIPRSVYRAMRGIEAADLLQEAYDEEDAAKPAETPHTADMRLSSYLAGIATAIALGRMHAAPRESVDAHGRSVTPEELFGNAELLARLKGIVSGLPRKERTLIERHYFRDQTLMRAARSLGLSKSWGSRLHARAIDRIARELQLSTCA
jgi:RNA polymerase sigma factor for flagellar operon FliA